MYAHASKMAIDASGLAGRYVPGMASIDDHPFDSTALAAGRIKVGFDDIDLGSDRFEPIVNGYRGLRWSHFNAYTNVSTTLGSGYETGLTSGSQGAFNVSALPAQVALSGGSFTLKSVNLTAAWNSTQTVEIFGYRHGEEVYHVTVTLDDLGPTKVLLDFENVRRVRFVPSGGTDDPALDGQGQHIVFDDFVFTNVHVRDSTTNVAASFGEDRLSTHPEQFHAVSIPSPDLHILA